jgi:hypothetical protein
VDPCATPASTLALVVALVGALLALAWVGGIAWNLWQLLKAREHRDEVVRLAREQMLTRRTTAPRSTVGFRVRDS